MIGYILKYNPAPHFPFRGKVSKPPEEFKKILVIGGESEKNRRLIDRMAQHGLQISDVWSSDHRFDALPQVDAIFVLTDLIAHKVYNRIRLLADKSGIPVINGSSKWSLAQPRLVAAGFPVIAQSAKTNPFSPGMDFSSVEQYANAEVPTETQRQAVSDLLGRNAEIGRAREWPVTPSALSTYFPTKGEQKLWEPGERLKAGLTNFDLVQRVDSRDRKDFDPARDPLRWDDQTIETMARQLGLSVDDALRIIRTQRARFSEKRNDTLPPSAAICKSFRCRKVKNYHPPAEVLKMTKADVLIWLSPVGAAARVMQYRKGNHVDCDMAGEKLGEDLTSLLSRAVQSNMYWMVEKAKRESSTRIWVGRAGQGCVYLAYRPGDRLNIQSITQNLRTSMSDTTGNFKVCYTKDPQVLKADIDAWDDAISRVEAAPSFGVPVTAPSSPPSAQTTMFGAAPVASSSSTPPRGPGGRFLPRTP